MKCEKRCGSGRDSLIHLLYGGCVLAFLLVFFLSYRPLIIDNFDDWTYIAFTRPAVPQADAWNPAKVLPEILLPACVQFALWFVYPLTGDYVGSVSLVLGVVLCLFILLYVYQLDRLLIERLRLPVTCTVLVSALFFIFHFKAFMSPWIASQHLFYSADANNSFNYTIPALMNISLVLYLERVRLRANETHSPVGMGMLLLALYLAVFSNLYANCILAVYAGCRLLVGAVQWAGKKKKLMDVVREQAVPLVILGLWLVCALFELFGGRAGWAKEGPSLLDQIKTTVSALLVQIERMDDFVFYLCLGLVLAALLVFALSRGRSEEDRAYGGCAPLYLLCGAVTLVHQVLLCAVVAPDYIVRMDVLICPVIFIFMAALCSCAYLIKKWKYLAVVLPLLVFITGFDVLIGVESFAYGYVGGQTPQEIFTINRAMIAQILEADAQGMEEMTLHVPKTGDGYNYPYPYTLGGRMQTSLSSQKVIRHVERILIEPDEAFFEKYPVK